MIHLLTKTAENVDKVAEEDEADGGDVQKKCSVVLAVPNVAVLPYQGNDKTVIIVGDKILLHSLMTIQLTREG